MQTKQKTQHETKAEFKKNMYKLNEIKMNKQIYHMMCVCGFLAHGSLLNDTNLLLANLGPIKIVVTIK